MNETTKALKKHAEEARERLETFRDELAVKAHLGKKEAEDGWRQTEKFLNGLVEKLRTFSSKIETGASEAELQLHLGLMEAKANWDIFEKIFKDSLKDLRTDAKSLEGKVDLAKLHAHLAKMEAGDFVETQRTQLKDKLAAIKKEVAANSSDLLSDIRKSIEAIQRSLPK